MDSGANGNFVTSNWVRSAHVKALERVGHKDITFANGQSECSQSMLPHAHLRLQDHRENITMDIIDLQGYDAISGQPWLTKHNPHIDWKRHQLTLHQGRNAKLTLHGILKSEQGRPDSSATPKPLSACQFKRLVRKREAKAYVAMVRAVPSPDIAAAASDQPQHPAAQNLIAEFQDVFPADLPKRLPPMRDLDHGIEHSRQ